MAVSPIFFELSHSVDGQLLSIDEIIGVVAKVFGLTSMIVCTALLAHRQ